MICDICKIDRSTGETVRLTSEEVAYLKSQQSYEKSTYFYCSACWGMIQGRHSANFIANHFGMTLTSAGVAPIRALRMTNALQKSLEELKKKIKK